MANPREPLTRGVLAPSQLQLGPLLAEGGEGRVFEVAGIDAVNAGIHAVKEGTADLVFKQLHHPRAGAQAGDATRYLATLSERAPNLAARVKAAAAWPLAAVETSEGDVLGFVCRRAPERFWLAHRDGSRRLAVLSYLSSDPDRVAVSYGVDVSAPGSAQRAGVVYALARLLDAWQRREGDLGAVVHGDLSSKNVLWSNGPVPEVFVLDCDGAVLVRPGGAEGPYRPATPNWDDPARGPGAPIAVTTDRYLLGIIFLRVLGAAHFPIQGRQRQGATVDVDLELPRAWRHMSDMPALWSLCERSLSVVRPEERPAPDEWALELEHLLDALGAGALGASIRAAQGDPEPSRVPAPGAVRGPAPAPVPDVHVRPVLRQRSASTWQLVRTGPVVAGTGGPGGATLIVPLGAGAPVAAGLFGVPPGSPPNAYIRAGWATFRATHRLVARLLRSPGRRVHGLRRLAGVVLVDLAVASLGLFLFGMIVSPWIGL